MQSRMGIRHWVTLPGRLPAALHTLQLPPCREGFSPQGLSTAWWPRRAVKIRNSGMALVRLRRELQIQLSAGPRSLAVAG